MIRAGRIEYVESLRDVSEGGIMNVRVIGLAAIVVATCTVSAFAHHSFSMFDETKTVIMSGTVKEFEWTNPHCWLRMTVNDEKTGKPVVWAYELSSPARLITMGMSAKSVKFGDVVSVTFHPMKDGTRAGRFLGATLPNGKVILRSEAGDENEER
jgi:hypothetical protein